MNDGNRGGGWNPTTDKVLALIFVVAGLAAVLLSLLLYFSIEKNSIAFKRRKSARELSSLTHFLERYFKQLLDSQKYFASKHSEAEISPEVERELRLIRNLMRGHFISAVSLISQDMKLLRTFPKSDRTGADLSSQLHNATLAKTNRPVISSPFVAVQGYKTIAVATPLKSEDGEYHGSLTYLLNFDDLLSFLVETLKIDENDTIHIFDETGTPLYSMRPLSASSLRTAVSENASSNSRGFFSHRIADDNGVSTHFISYSFLYLPTGKRWLMCIDSPENAVLPGKEFWSVLTYVIPIAFFLILIGSLALTRWFFIRHHAALLEKSLEAERASLAAADSRLSLMLDTLPYMIFELDLDGRITFLRISQSIEDCDSSHLRAGTLKDALAAESRDSFEKAFNHIVSTGKPLHALRIALRCAPDAPPKTCSLSAFPVFDDDGEVVGVNGVMHDITERLALEASLIQSQKMEVVGAVTNSVAHDFNNYIATMMGCLDLIRLKHPEIEDLDILRSALNKAAALTEQLLSFSRTPKTKQESCDINSALRQTVKMLKKTRRKPVAIKFDLAQNLPEARMSQSNLDQIVMNLVVNAYDAIQEEGEIVIRTWKLDLHAIHAEQLNLPPGEYIMLEISDNGPGMDEKTRAKVFEPYFTTKQNGTGLGLATVHTIVKQINGRIILKSALGRGTTFSIYIPAA